MEIKVPFTNISLTDRKTMDGLHKLEKLVTLEKLGKTPSRGKQSKWKAFSDKDRDYQFRIPKGNLYLLTNASSVLKTIFISLRSAIFRNGAEFVPRFVTKCTTCQREYQYKKDSCDCGGKTREPNWAELAEARKWFEESVNDNKQTLLDMSKSAEDDLQVIDDVFIQVRKDYYFDTDGKIRAGEIKEILRVEPTVIEFVQDNANRFGYNKDGQEQNVCPAHRETAVTAHRCQCGLRTYPAYFYIESLYGGETKRTYLINDEIIHRSKYSPGMGRGTSPIYAVINMVNALISQDKSLDAWYSGERYPKSLMIWKTNQSRESIKETWNDYLQNLETNPHYLAPIVIQNTGADNQSSVEQVKLFDTFVEMQFVETRQAGRNEVGALFGVQPMFMGDTSTGGGLNNEGTQVTVTNRAFESGQSVWNSIYDELIRMFGVKDFTYKLKPNEEQDEKADEELMTMRLQNAKLAASMGLVVQRNDEGVFEYSGQVDPAKASGQMPQPPSLGGNGQVGMPSTGNEAPPIAQIASGQNFAGEPVSTSKMAKPLDDKKMDDVLDQVVKDLEMKRKVPEDVLVERVRKIAEKFGSRIRTKTVSEIKAMYTAEYEKVGGPEIKPSFDSRDENAIKLIENSKVFNKAFKNMSDSLQEKIKEIISKSYEKPNFSLDEMVAEMQDATEAKKSDLERIARTEGQNISNLARVNAYEKMLPADTKYRWSTASDDRVTDYCKAIKEASDKGVTMEEMKQIVAQHGDKGTYDPSRPFTPHLNCRSSIVRKV